MRDTDKPGDLLERAIQLHNSGEFDQAKSLYYKVLETHPHHAGMRHMLGLAEHQSGQFGAAIDHLKKAAAAEPRNAVYAGNLGVAYKAKGDMERAITAFKKAIGIDPSIAALHNNLGAALHENGDHSGASDSFTKALALNARYPEAETNLGKCLMRLGEPDNAIAHFRKALGLDPDFADAHTQLGLAYIETGRDSAAAESLTRAAERNPDPEIFTQLGMTLHRLNRFDEASAAFSEALALKPGDATILCHLARCESGRGHLDQAEQLYQAAIGTGDRRGATFFALAGVLRDLGRMHEALQNYRWAIKADPDNAAAHHMIAASVRFTGENDDVSAIRQAHARAEPGSNSRMHLGFALGKVEEDLGQYEQAFAHIAEANRLHRQTISYDAYQARHWAEAIIDLFSADLFQLNAGVGLAEAGPVFILGMPRAGNSLVQQILSAHASVHTAGELDVISAILEDAGLTDPEMMFSARIASLPAEQFADLGRAYLSRTKHLAPAARYIVNKVPDNFWRAGMIKLMLPNARMIHCRRHPVDNCLSIFKHYSSTGVHRFGYDLGELGAYYATYRKLMAHWHKVLPGQIYDLDFETLAMDREGESRKLLNWLGLAQNEDQNHGQIPREATLSPWPNLAASINLSSHYGEALRPLIEALEDAG